MGKVRMQFTALTLRIPSSLSVSFVVGLTTPMTFASVPAGAFQTPRVASVLGYEPAMKPHGGKSVMRP